MRTLYPELEPFEVGRLKVSDVHDIYFEQSGCATGQAILFVHGGPGSNSSPVHRRFFDPEHYRIVLFDQRGCGKSTPSGSVVDNTTGDLVEDVEGLRVHLGISRWILFGGSWGSALALAYAQKYTQNVTGMILRGVFTVSPREVAWFYQDGASRLLPDHFEKFRSHVPAAEQHDLVGAYHRLLGSSDRAVRVAAARQWCLWEAVASYLIPKPDYADKFENQTLSLAFATIECHYFIHNGFFASEASLLDGVDVIRHLPAKIIQGRYDLVCPMEAAWALHRAWPEADFRVVATAGHSAFEESITDELIRATDEFRAL